VTVWTVGHGTRSTEELVELLGEADVRTLVDVRRFPASRRHPHMARERLAVDLPRGGIRYEWRGDALGGRRKGSPGSRHAALRDPSFRAYADHMASAEFQAALEALLEEERPAVMCAETLWWRCHRRLIADALVARGVEVVHLIGPGQHAAHRLTGCARLAPEGGLVYDRVDLQQDLPFS
jgi:uncharacterized protein (DUF488 family)